MLRQFPKFFNNRVGKIMNLDRNYGFTDRSIIEMKRRSRHRLFRTRTFDYILLGCGPSTRSFERKQLLLGDALSHGEKAVPIPHV